MKSYITMFSDLYDALAKDIVTQYPAIQGDVERDLSRLHRSLNSEGLSFITITHGAMCDFFQKSLCMENADDLASLEATRPRGYGKKSSTDKRPRYLWGLQSLVFTIDGELRTDADVNAIAFIRQWLLMAKKVEIDCDEKRKECALLDFLEVDSGLPPHHPDTWDLDDPVWVRRTGHPLWGARSSSETASLFGDGDRSDEAFDWDDFRKLADRVRSVIGTFDPWEARPKHGPGAWADEDAGLKYDFKYWPRKLQNYFPWDYHASPDLGYWRHFSNTEPEEREFPSVVLCVPKTQKGPRIICKEPIAHVWMQGAVERFLIERMRSSVLGVAVNIKDQSLSRELALAASVSGRLATIDLSSASDRISTRLVEYIFGGCEDTSLLDALHACRSRYFVLNGTYHRFRKFAPAGSSCTFPVQSLIFLTLSLFALLTARGWSVNDWMRALPLIRVYGDDIIIPADASGVLNDLFTSVGLKVNASKSYATGLFRESCGMDAYGGWDVTPAYVRRIYRSSQPSSLQSVVDASNNLFQRGYWHTADALLKTVPMKERKLLPVGYSEGGAVSLYSFCGTDLSHLSSRFDKNLHRDVYSCIATSSQAKRTQSDGDAGLIQFFSEEPDPLTNYSSGQSQRPVSRKTRRWV